MTTVIRRGSDWAELGDVALGGHEYLENGRSRGFYDDPEHAMTPGFIAPGFGGAGRRAVVEEALQLGVRVFDVTIDAEKEALGRNLAELGATERVLVQTRPEGMCYGYDPGNRTMLDPAALAAEVGRSLRLLRRDTIELLNIGLLNWSIDETPDFMVRLADNLDGLRKAGKIRFAVADSFSGERLYRAQIESGAFDMVNVNFNVADDGAAEHVIPRAHERGMPVLGREVFAKGELFRIAARLGVDDPDALARSALQWVGNQPARPDILLIGAATPELLRRSTAGWRDAAHSAAADTADSTLDELMTQPAFREIRDGRRADFLAGRGSTNWWAPGDGIRHVVRLVLVVVAGAVVRDGRRVPRAAAASSPNGRPLVAAFARAAATQAKAAPTSASGVGSSLSYGRPARPARSRSSSTMEPWMASRRPR
jgi:aryl-alcohol dehydrogenase-like predicted oxidoreductase